MIQFFAGIAFFLLGVYFLSHNLQVVASNFLKGFFSKHSRKNYFNFLWGVILTLILQSSNAVVGMLMGLSSNRVLSLRVIMGLLLGSAMASAIMIKLLTFSIFEYGIYIFVFGFFLRFFSANRGESKKTLYYVGSTFLGLGMMLYGLNTIFEASHHIQEVGLLMQFLNFLKQSHVNLFLACMVFTAILHSSTAFLLVIIALASASVFSFEQAVVALFAVNAGAGIPMFLNSYGGDYRQRRVAVANVFLRTGCGVLFIPFVAGAIQIVKALSLDISHQISTLYTMMNLLGVLIFYFTLPFCIDLVKKLVPMTKITFSPKYLVRNFDHKSSLLALLTSAEREIFRMGGYIEKNVKASLNMFHGTVAPSKISARDKKIDILNQEIQLYLAEVLNFSKHTEDHRRILYLSSFVLDLESAGDVVDNTLRRLAKKQNKMMLSFDAESLEDLKSIYAKTLEISQLSLSYFVKQDRELALQVIQLKRELKAQEAKIKEKYLLALGGNLRKDRVKNSTLFMDVVAGYREIGSLLCRHVYHGKFHEDFDPDQDTNSE